jgi:hypothetical protein
VLVFANVYVTGRKRVSKGNALLKSMMAAFPNQQMKVQALATR